MSVSLTMGGSTLTAWFQAFLSLFLFALGLTDLYCWYVLLQGLWALKILSEKKPSSSLEYFPEEAARPFFQARLF